MSESPPPTSSDRPAGWYVDADRPHLQRRWDGSGWTGMRSGAAAGALVAAGDDPARGAAGNRRAVQALWVGFAAFLATAVSISDELGQVAQTLAAVGLVSGLLAVGLGVMGLVDAVRQRTGGLEAVGAIALGLIAAALFALRLLLLAGGS
jgi:hypothetical protein